MMNYVNWILKMYLFNYFKILKQYFKNNFGRQSSKFFFTFLFFFSLPPPLGLGGEGDSKKKNLKKGPKSLLPPVILNNYYTH